MPLGEEYSKSFMTKIQIAQAFNTLCESIPYERISVDMIAKAANISRSGFYYHFDDKDAVIQWLSLHCYSAGLNETGRTLTWFEGHLVTTRRFARFKTLFVAGSVSRDYTGGQPFYVRNRQENLTETLVVFQRKKLTPLLKFQIEALPYAEATMANKYHAGELDVSVKKYCEMAESLVPRELHEALAKPVNPIPKDMIAFLH